MELSGWHWLRRWQVSRVHPVNHHGTSHCAAPPTGFLGPISPAPPPRSPSDHPRPQACFPSTVAPLHDQLRAAPAPAHPRTPPRSRPRRPGPCTGQAGRGGPSPSPPTILRALRPPRFPRDSGVCPALPAWAPNHSARPWLSHPPVQDESAPCGRGASLQPTPFSPNCPCPLSSLPGTSEASSVRVPHSRCRGPLAPVSRCHRPGLNPQA